MSQCTTSRLGRNCSVLPPTSESIYAGKQGRKMAPANFFVPREMSPYMIWNQYKPISLPLCSFLLLCCLFAGCCLFLRAGTWLTCPLGLTSAKSADLNIQVPNSWNLAPLVLKTRYCGDLFSSFGLLCAFPSLGLQLPPYCGQHLVFAFPYLSKVASSLHSVVEFVLPIFGSLPSLYTWM